MHILHHYSPTTNGAPQTVAVGFASLIFFSLLLPFAKVSIQDSLASEVLLQLLRTDAGFNVFALLLLLAPPIGVAVSLFARSTWRVGTLAVSIIALAMIPLTFMQFDHGQQHVAQGMEVVTPGLASYVLMLGYAILAITTGVVAFRARHSHL
jgi:hypothetical protein